LAGRGVDVDQAQAEPGAERGDPLGARGVGMRTARTG